MAATLAFSDVQDALRIMYDDSAADQTIKTHPHLAMIAREEDFHDQFYRLPVKVGNPLGVATTLQAAQANATASAPKAFNLTKIHLYNAPKVAGELVEAGKVSGAERLLKDAANIIDGAKTSMQNAMGLSGYRNSAGVFATVAAGTASPITVVYPQDLYEIEVGHILTASANADMSTPRAGTGVVTAIDKDAGTITYTGTITAIAPGDYLAISGLTSVASGLLAWSPITAPTATLFFGLDRTQSPYLAGRRVAATNYAPEEVWARVNAEMVGMEIKPDVFFLNPTDLALFEVSVSGQKSMVNSRKYDFGLESLKAYGRELVADPDCPRGYAFGVPLDYWKMYSLAAAPKILDADGNVLLRVSNADDYEARIGARYNFGTKAPYGLMTIALPSG